MCRSMRATVMMVDETSTSFASWDSRTGEMQRPLASGKTYLPGSSPITTSLFSCSVLSLSLSLSLSQSIPVYEYYQIVVSFLGSTHVREQLKTEKTVFSSVAVCSPPDCFMLPALNLEKS